MVRNRHVTFAFYDQIRLFGLGLTAAVLGLGLGIQVLVGFNTDNVRVSNTYLSYAVESF
jgi:hypothetical protein